MEVEKRKIELEKKDSEIIYSKAIKAGKRIYYLDVKKSRNDDLYLAITESKKKVTGYDEDAQVTYEKHKIFLYKEDIGFIKQEQGEPIPRPEYNHSQNDSNVLAEEIAPEVKEITEPTTTGETKRSFFDKFKF